MKLRKLTLNINGADRMFICDPETDTLATVLRRLGLTGTKIGCGKGLCGSCSVILNGKVIRSCTKKITTVDEYSTVTTIEGIGAPNFLHPLQVAFMHLGAVQCGFCSPGFIVSVYGLLQENQIRPEKMSATDSRKTGTSAAIPARSKRRRRHGSSQGRSGLQQAVLLPADPEVHRLGTEPRVNT